MFHKIHNSLTRDSTLHLVYGLSLRLLRCRVSKWQFKYFFRDASLRHPISSYGSSNQNYRLSLCRFHSETVTGTTPHSWCWLINGEFGAIISRLGFNCVGHCWIFSTQLVRPHWQFKRSEHTASDNHIRACRRPVRDDVIQLPNWNRNLFPVRSLINAQIVAKNRYLCLAYPFPWLADIS